MNSMKVRAYKDGNNFVLYFEDCNPDMEKFLKNMLSPLMEGDSLLEEAEKESIDPVLPTGIGQYSGKHVSEVLSEYGNRGYATVAYLLNKNVLSDEADVREMLNQYLFDTFSGIDPMEYAGSLSMEQADEWLKCFDSLVGSSLKLKAKNLMGYEDYDAFLKSGSLEQKSSMIYNILLNMGFFE